GPPPFGGWGAPPGGGLWGGGLPFAWPPSAAALPGPSPFAVFGAPPAACPRSGACPFARPPSATCPPPPSGPRQGTHPATAQTTASTRPAAPANGSHRDRSFERPPGEFDCFPP